MKKILSIVALMIMAFVLVACGGDESDWKIVMITDVGTITDKSFNQGTWEGVEKFGKDHNITTQYYRPNDGTQKDYEEAIDFSVANGANVIVTPGFLFETAIYTSQTKYPNVHFILIDGQPHDGNYNFKTEKNTVNILFQEEQPGFLAGYAAVAEGYDTLGFMGGMAVPAVVKFGIGYVAGAFYAAKELDKEITFDANRYEYLGSFDNLPEYTTRAASWYDADVDVIFAAAGGAGNSVMAAAAQKDKKVIGVDIDQAGESPTVVSSAMKQLSNAVYQELTALVKDDKFKAGETLYKGAKEDAIGLPKGDSFRFKTFTETQYDAVYKLVKDGTVVVPQTMSDLTKFLKDHAGDPDVAALVSKTQPAT